MIRSGRSRNAHRTFLDEVGLEGPPFDPRILASFKDATIAEVNMVGAARLLPTQHGLMIEVNAAHSRRKQNFSIDHEVSHILMPTYRNQPVDDAVTGTFPNNAEEELLCDTGAATLLLDPRAVHPIASGAQPGIAILEHIAYRFQASLEATARRLASLNLWPCAFVFWEDGFRSGQTPQVGPGLFPDIDALSGPAPRLRVTRIYKSPSFSYYIPENKSVGEDSVVARCVACGPMAATERFDFGNRVVELFADCASVQLRGHERRRVLTVLLSHSPDGPQQAFDAAELLFLDE